MQKRLKQTEPWRHSKHLLGEPGAAGLSDPLPGVDPGVDPDGGTVGSTGAELRNRNIIHQGTLSINGVLKWEHGSLLLDLNV